MIYFISVQFLLDTNGMKFFVCKLKFIFLHFYCDEFIYIS